MYHPRHLFVSICKRKKISLKTKYGDEYEYLVCCHERPVITIDCTLKYLMITICTETDTMMKLLAEYWQL